jgi:AcrR family transcriptional regulator
MSVRQEGQRERERRVKAVAFQLFVTRGYAGTSVRDIAGAAGVSTGTVRNVGDKASLFLLVMEEAATSTALDYWTAIAQTPPSRERSLAAEVMEYFDAQLDIAEAHPQLFRDYWAAYVARVQHADNESRLTDVVDAIARRWCQHAGRPAPDEEALLAAYTMFSTYSVTILGICTGLDTARYRGYLRAIVERESRPAEPNAAGRLPATPRVVLPKRSLETTEDLKGQS